MIQALAALLFILPSANETWSVIQNDWKLAVNSGRITVNLRSYRHRAYLGPGWSLELGWGDGYVSHPTVLYGDGRAIATLDRTEIHDTFLKADEYWGPGKEGNNARYAASYGPGLSLFFLDAVKMGDKALCVLAWRHEGPSSRPVYAQHLAWLTLEESPKLEFIERVADPIKFSYRHPKRVLFWSNGKLLMLRGRSIVELDTSGRVAEVVAEFDGSIFPVGSAGSDHVVFTTSYESGTGSRVESVYSIHRRTRGIKKVATAHRHPQIWPSNTEPVIIMNSNGNKSDGLEEKIVVHIDLSSGKVLPLETDSDNYIIGSYGDTLFCLTQHPDLLLKVVGRSSGQTTQKLKFPTGKF